MKYIALLRGINVGGNNKVDMKLLKTTFEGIGMLNVSTYINTGNILFEDNTHKATTIADLLEKAIEKDFNLNIKVLIRTQDQINDIYKHIPVAWENDKTMRSNVLFLWEDIDTPNTLKTLDINKSVDEAMYVSGAILWSVLHKDYSNSGYENLAKNKLYKKMTIRNINTFRKIHEIINK